MKCLWGIQHRAQQTVSADDCRGDPCALHMGLGVGAGFCIDGSVELGTSLPPLWAAHQEEMMATWITVGLHQSMHTYLCVEAHGPRNPQL